MDLNWTDKKLCNLKLIFLNYSFWIIETFEELKNYPEP